ncbi:MAG TPA: alpha-amylase family glycosyl hydrolase [Isosphaeraceae bacterium]|jgi:glycosidase|nr:alpha-amylase family glycosyl hydrolase [Isosphaeraceae bacterium]
MRYAAAIITLVCASFAPAEEVTIDRVNPPSWWTSGRPQEVTLLIEGSGLTDARVSLKHETIRIGRSPPGRDGHALFVDVTIPADARPDTLTIDVEVNGHHSRHPFVLSPHPTHTPQPFGPDDVIYLVMPDRFANGDPANDELESVEPMLDREDPHAYHGGDFLGLRQKLPYLVDLGVTAIWLTPVYRPAPRWFVTKVDGRERRYADFHGYSPIDFYDSNPRFGSLDDYRALVAEAHRLGLKVIQDQILGYTGPRHHWVTQPPADQWFHGPMDKPPACTFRFDALINPHALDADRRGMTDGWFFGILPDLDTTNESVRRYAIQQSLWWTTFFQADGIRLDTYPMVERTFWRDWSRRLKAEYPELQVVGEAWVTDPAELAFFQGGRVGWDGIDPGIDSVFDFPLNLAIHEVFSGKAPASRLAKTLARDAIYPHPERLVTFLDNHDTPRLAAAAGVTPVRQRLAAAFLLTTRGIPQMTWGDEIGLPGHMDDRREIPGAFPGDARDAFTHAGRTPDEQATFAAWRALLHLRKDHVALRRGRLIDLVVSDTTYAYLRQHGDERLVIVLNLGDQPATIEVPPEPLGTIAGVDLVYGSGQATPSRAGLHAVLPAQSVAIFRLR